jgi:hypothetical protein
MSTLVTRSGKGSPLTHNEVDTNFTNLNTDKVEKTAADITGGTINNTTIGATTPSTGVFTTLTATTAGTTTAKVWSNTGTTPIADLELQRGTTSTWGGDAFTDYRIRASGGNFILQSQNNTTAVLDLLTVDEANNAIKFSPVGVEQVRVAYTASAVNYLQLTGSATGNGPRLLAQGTDADVRINYITKGSGSHTFATDANAGTVQFNIARTASAVNYVQVTGAATGAPSQPIISAQGSDANINIALQGKGTGSAVLLDSGGGSTLRAIPRATGGDTWVDVCRSVGGVSLQASSAVTNGALIFQSKGTGAIDLAAGSSGVNISNGGTVTAITRTNAGSGYTSFPTPAITAPTTAGGVQATATVTNMFAAGVTIAGGGTGYTVGNVLTVSGGTPQTAVQLTVSTVSAGVITAVTISTAGAYTALPTNPVSVTGGTGSSATFNLTWSVIGFTITNAGSGYVEQPTVTFSGGGGSGAAAYATVGSAVILKSIGGTLDLSTTNGIGFRIYDSGGTIPSAGYWAASSGTSSPFLWARGGTNTAGLITSSGTGSVSIQTNSGSQTQFVASHTASAVNYVQVTGAATGGLTQISSQGSDASVPISYVVKGFAAHRFCTNSTTSDVQFLVYNTTTARNYLQVTGATVGNSPRLEAAGSDTNIDIIFTPKGTTGNVRFGTYTGTILTPTGYVEIKDSGGTVRRLLVG